MLSPVQLEFRAKAIGASETPILRGKTSYGDPGQILLAKRGVVVTPLESSKWMEFGNLTEDQIRTEAEKKLYTAYEHLFPSSRGEVSYVYHPTHQGATPDGVYLITPDTIDLLEIKTTSQRWEALPDRVLEQVQQQLYVVQQDCGNKTVRGALVAVYETDEAEIDRCMVAFATGKPFHINPEQLRFEWVAPDPVLQQELAEFCLNWWETHVTLGLPLGPTEPEQKPKLADTVIDLQPLADKVHRFEEIRSVKDALDIEQEGLKKEILAALGDSKKGQVDGLVASKTFVAPKPSVDKTKAWDSAKSLLSADQVAAIEAAYNKSGASYWRFEIKEAK